MSRGSRKLTAEQYKALCFSILERDNWRCTVCKTRNNLQVHHIKFRSQCGEDTPENLATVCIRCHNKVHSRKLTIQNGKRR